MTELLISRTQETPGINFNPSSGILRISGRAYSSDISLFYKTMDAWLMEYLATPSETTTVEIQLEYYNSVFSKLLLIFFEKCKTVLKKDKKLVLKWYHEKDDRESIDDSRRVSKIINFPIETVESE